MTATRRVERGRRARRWRLTSKSAKTGCRSASALRGRSKAPFVFVGYGITAADQNYDDYKGAEVKDKVAVAFAGTPDGDNPHGRFTRAGELRFKAAAARAAGAKALVVIAADEKFKDDRLSRLRFDNAGGDAGLPVAVISRQAAAKVLGLTAAALLLAEFEKSLRERRSAAARVAVVRDDGVGQRRRAQPDDRRGPEERAGRERRRHPRRLRREVEVRRSSSSARTTTTWAAAARGAGVSPRARATCITARTTTPRARPGCLSWRASSRPSARSMRRTVVFIAFGGEEEGLIGSSHYVQNPALPLGADRGDAQHGHDRAAAKDGALNVGGVGTASELRAMVEEANRGYKVTLHPPAGGSGSTEGEGKEVTLKVREEGKPDREVKGRVPDRDPIVVTGANGRTAVTARPAERFALRLSEDGFGPSDHSSFYARRVPVLFFFTGAHEDYHKPSDTADRINYEGEAQILQLVRDIVLRLQERDARPTYAVAKAEANTRTTFRVSLGTVPSYGESTDGLKLDAVREGSPARPRRALKAGDKIVKLAGRDIRNVYDYTQALSEMKAGQEYEVELLRDGQRLTLKITAGGEKVEESRKA